MPEESKEQVKPMSASSKSRIKIKIDQSNNPATNQANTQATARSSRAGSAQSTRRVSVNQSSNQTNNQSNVNSPIGSPKQRSIEEILGFWPYKPPSLLSPSNNQSSSSPKSSNQSNNQLNHYPKVLQLVQENKPNELLSYLQSIEQSVHRTAAVQSMDGDGNPVIFHALAPSHSAIFQILLDYGALVQSSSGSNNQSSNQFVSQFNNQSINQPVNQKLNTALHIAVHYGYKKVQPTLIEFGASLKAENWEHQQPYQMAITQSNNQSNQSNKSSASDRVQQAQNYLNSLYEAHTEKLALYQTDNQTIHQSMIVDPLVRGYYRSVFDLCDQPRINQIPYQIFHQTINQFIESRKESYFAENPPPHVRLTIADREKLAEQAKSEVVAQPAKKGAKEKAAPAKETKPSKQSNSQSNNQSTTPEPPTTNQIIESFLSSIDADHNGSINFPEFLVAMIQLEADREAAKKGKTKKSKGSKKGKSKSKK